MVGKNVKRTETTEVTAEEKKDAKAYDTKRKAFEYKLNKYGLSTNIQYLSDEQRGEIISRFNLINPMRNRVACSLEDSANEIVADICSNKITQNIFEESFNTAVNDFYLYSGRGTGEAEYRIIHLLRMVNPIPRMVLGNKKAFRDSYERSHWKQFKKSFLSGKTEKVDKVSVNITQEAAWAAVMSYVTDIFWKNDSIVTVINLLIAEGSDEAIKVWNDVITDMKKVFNGKDLIQKFTIKDKKCGFIVAIENAKNGNDKDDHPHDDEAEATIEEVIEEAMENIEDPEVDPTVIEVIASAMKEAIIFEPKVEEEKEITFSTSANKPIVIEVPVEDITVVKEVKEIPKTEEVNAESIPVVEEAKSVEEAQQSAADSTTINPLEVVATLIDKGKKNIAQEEEKAEVAAEETKKEETIVVEEAKSVEETVPAEEIKVEEIPVQPAPVIDTSIPMMVDAEGNMKNVTYDKYFFNNAQWENYIPKLSRLTEIIHSLGYSVAYAQDINFTGLAIASILKNDAPVTILRLDPYIIYGDTLRIVTITNNNADIRKETFIPISNENTIKKLINGEFGPDDRKRVLEGIPRSLNDYTTGYSFIDRVDMRGLGLMCKNLSMKDWKAFIVNASSTLQDSTLQNIRFRVKEYTNPNKFTLVADGKDMCCYANYIYGEPNHAEAVAKVVTVEYNSDLAVPHYVIK